ncbi:MAG: prephenate dehydrogenase [Acidobacteriota bacterium]
MALDEIQQWKQVTVVGCGLIGSSFALALKQHKCCDRVLGWDISAAHMNEAIALGAIDGADQAFARGEVSEADLLYLAMPVSSIIDFLTKQISQTKPGAIITDAGSTKRSICETAAKYIPIDRHFVGGHPITGSHLSGVKHASAKLMTGANYALIDDGSRDSTSFTRLKQTLNEIGARTKVMTATEHDRAFALVSHLPQLLSSALASVVEDQEDTGRLLKLAGPGYKDMTRLADSSWSMWRDVLATNHAEISSGLDQMIDKLTLMREELRDGQLLNDSILSSLFREKL